MNELNRIEGLDFETMEALTGEAAIPYREGRAMSLESCGGLRTHRPV